MWEAVKTSARKVRMEKAKGGGSRGRSREETRGERQKKEIEKREDDGSKKSGRKMGDLG